MTKFSFAVKQCKLLTAFRYQFFKRITCVEYMELHLISELPNIKTFFGDTPRLLNLLAQTIAILKNNSYKYCQPLPRSIRGSRRSMKEKVSHFRRRLVHRLSLPSLHYLRNRLRKSLGTCLQF